MEETFGEKLRRLRTSYRLDGKKLSGEKLAEALGVTQGFISALERGEKMPGRKLAMDIARFFNVSADYLLGNTDADAPQAAPSAHSAASAGGMEPHLLEKSNVKMGRTIPIPVLSMEMVASCGTGAGLYGVNASPDDIVYIEPSDIEHYDEQTPPFGIRISGDSMAGAGLDEGTIAAVNPADEVISGDMGLVVFDDNWFIKWVIWYPDGAVELRSANPAYAPIRIEKEYAAMPEWFTVKGKVVSIIRKNKPPRAF